MSEMAMIDGILIVFGFYTQYLHKILIVKHSFDNICLLFGFFLIWFTSKSNDGISIYHNNFIFQGIDIVILFIDNICLKNSWWFFQFISLKKINQNTSLWIEC